MKKVKLEKAQIDMLIGSILGGKADLRFDQEQNQWQVIFFLDGDLLKFALTDDYFEAKRLMIKVIMMGEFIDNQKILREGVLKPNERISSETILFSTRPSEEFQLLGDLFYKKNNKGVFVKKLSSNIQEYLDEDTMGHFWMNSGCMLRDKESGKVYCTFYMSRFSNSDIHLIKETLKCNFNIESFVKNKRIYIEEKFRPTLYDVAGMGLIPGYVYGLDGVDEPFED